MKRFAFLALLILVGGMMLEVTAQIPGSRIPPRKDDHFWRRKVTSRIDFAEKINEPFTYTELTSLYSSPDYGETQGIVVALINGLKSGKFLAYDPDSLNKPLTYPEVVKIAQKIEGTEDSGWDDSGDGFDDFDAGGDFGDFDDGGDDWGDEFGGDDLGEGDTDPFGAAAVESNADFEIAPYETVMEFIEDHIFDKNRSDMVYDIQYLRLVWIDPGETLPDKNFICFRYSEVLGTLEDTQWKNKFNDAEYRNLREIFELRLFHSYILDVSGRGSRSLEESDFRRNQLVEFEHHLWSY